MLTEDEIVSTLKSQNGIYFTIDDLYAYARKLLEKGKAAYIRENNELISYVLYYDDGPEVFISMVWTNPRFLNRGYASQLLTKLIRSTKKCISLEVDVRNPAQSLYRKLDFKIVSASGTRQRMAIGRRIAIMQPYVYPYIGYFHLINASDLIIFYDDVNYIKRGRINRNNILVNGSEFCFAVPIVDASQNRLIKDTHASYEGRWKTTFFKQLTHSYKKAPYFDSVMTGIEAVFGQHFESIADLAIASLISVHNYLGANLGYVKSSEFSPETRGMEKSERLIAITKKAGGDRYVNTIGGVKLYSKEIFKDRGVDLGFVKSELIEYNQFRGVFVPWLSIIDVMMFNDCDTIKKFLKAYSIT